MIENEIPYPPHFDEIFDIIENHLEKHGSDKSIKSISELDGYIAAICSAPSIIMSSTWMPGLWGGEKYSPNWKSVEDFNEFAELVLAYYHFVMNSLKMDEYSVLFEECEIDGKSHNFVNGWCAGYLRGINLWGPLSANKSAILAEFLRPMLLFATESGFEELDTMSELDYEKHMQKIAPAAHSIYRYFHPQQFNFKAAPKVGRNDPCPCGSGKKYKKCCIDKDDIANQTDADVDMDTPPLEEVEDFANYAREQINHSGLDKFHGLSPHQMHQLLYNPLASPEIISVSEAVDAPNAPLITLFSLIVKGIGEQGLKATARGNLPRMFCQNSAHQFTAHPAWKIHPTAKVNKEEDFFLLHITRLVAEIAGLIKKTKGKFNLTAKAKSLIKREDLGRIYSLLFAAYTERFNWSYLDGYPDVHFMRTSAFFTLYLLTRYGDKARPQAFYEDQYIQAFPTLLEEYDEDYFSPEQRLRACYTLRHMDYFCYLFGFVDLQATTGKGYSRDYTIKALPLLQKCIKFKI